MVPDVGLVRFFTKTLVFKYREDITPFLEDKAELEFFHRYSPIDVFVSGKNLVLMTGANAICDRLCGGTSPAFSSAYTLIGVGDGTAEEDRDQTDLVGTNKAYAGMSSGYPIYGQNGKVIFQAAFGENSANFSWRERVIKNSQSGVCLLRTREDMMTKSGGTWVVQIHFGVYRDLL